MTRYPEVLVLLGVAVGLAVANVVARVVGSGFWLRAVVVWRLRWITRPSRLRKVRRATRQARSTATRVPVRRHRVCGPGSVTGKFSWRR